MGAGQEGLGHEIDGVDRLFAATVDNRKYPADSRCPSLTSRPACHLAVNHDWSETPLGTIVVRWDARLDEKPPQVFPVLGDALSQAF